MWNIVQKMLFVGTHKTGRSEEVNAKAHIVPSRSHPLPRLFLYDLIDRFSIISFFLHYFTIMFQLYPFFSLIFIAFYLFSWYIFLQVPSWPRPSCFSRFLIKKKRQKVVHPCTRKFDQIKNIIKCNFYETSLKLLKQYIWSINECITNCDWDEWIIRSDFMSNLGFLQERPIVDANLIDHNVITTQNSIRNECVAVYSFCIEKLNLYTTCIFSTR